MEQVLKFLNMETRIGFASSIRYQHSLAHLVQHREALFDQSNINKQVELDVKSSAYNRKDMQVLMSEAYPQLPVPSRMDIASKETH